jgi:hypothetical protein
MSLRWRTTPLCLGRTCRRSWPAGMAALALRFAILTAARTNEVLGAGETDTSPPRKVTLGRDAKGGAIMVTQGPSGRFRLSG